MDLVGSALLSEQKLCDEVGRKGKEEANSGESSAVQRVTKIRDKLVRSPARIEDVIVAMRCEYQQKRKKAESI